MNTVVYEATLKRIRELEARQRQLKFAFAFGARTGTTVLGADGEPVSMSVLQSEQAKNRKALRVFYAALAYCRHRWIRNPPPAVHLLSLVAALTGQEYDRKDVYGQTLYQHISSWADWTRQGVCLCVWCRRGARPWQSEFIAAEKKYRQRPQ